MKQHNYITITHTWTLYSDTDITPGPSKWHSAKQGDTT